MGPTRSFSISKIPSITREKDAARILVRNALRAVDFGKCERMVRINQLPMGLEDLAEIVPEAPDLVLLPKAELPEQIAETDRMIGELEEPLRHHASHLADADSGDPRSASRTRPPSRHASKNVVALTIGLEDYTADLGVAKTAEGRESLYARMRLVNAAKAAGIQAIDSVFGDVGDMDGLRRWAENSRALGFEGMGCIHPGQIPVIHEAFAPSQAEIEKALKIVAAFEEAQQRGLGVVSLGSKMIDPPVVERAQKLVERAKRDGEGVSKKRLCGGGSQTRPSRAQLDSFQLDSMTHSNCQPSADNLPSFARPDRV